jgi:hypothetical protein
VFTATAGATASHHSYFVDHPLGQTASTKQQQPNGANGYSFFVPAGDQQRKKLRLLANVLFGL